MNLEMDMHMHLHSGSSKHRGRSILATAYEGFNIESPQGNKHLALVFEPLREPLWLLRRRLTHQERASLGLFKIYMSAVLEGLDYLHSECHVIHTGMRASFFSYQWLI